MFYLGMFLFCLSCMPVKLKLNNEFCDEIVEYVNQKANTNWCLSL